MVERHRSLPRGLLPMQTTARLPHAFLRRAMRAKVPYATPRPDFPTHPYALFPGKKQKRGADPVVEQRRSLPWRLLPTLRNATARFSGPPYACQNIKPTPQPTPSTSYMQPHEVPRLRKFQHVLGRMLLTRR